MTDRQRRVEAWSGDRAFWLEAEKRAVLSNFMLVNLET